MNADRSQTDEGPGRHSPGGWEKLQDGRGGTGWAHPSTCQKAAVPEGSVRGTLSDLGRIAQIRQAPSTMFGFYFK